MDLFDLDYDLDREFFMNYTGNRPKDAYVELLGEYGFMGTLNNAAFYVNKKCWKGGCNLGSQFIKLYNVAIYKDWESDTDKNHWIGSVKYYSFIS